MACWVIGSHALDRVALTARRLELAAQQIHGLPFVGNELFDPVTHAVFDTRDLATDLFDVGLLAPVALTLAPEPRVLVPYIGHRPAHLAVETEPVAGLRARHLLAAPPTEDENRAHRVTSPLAGELDESLPRSRGRWRAAPDGGLESVSTFKSTTLALLSSRRRSGVISNTESGRPAAAQTTW